MFTDVYFSPGGAKENSRGRKPLGQFRDRPQSPARGERSLFRPSGARKRDGSCVPGARAPGYWLSSLRDSGTRQSLRAKQNHGSTKKPKTGTNRAKSCQNRVLPVKPQDGKRGFCPKHGRKWPNYLKKCRENGSKRREVSRELRDEYRVHSTSSEYRVLNTEPCLCTTFT